MKSLKKQTQIQETGFGSVVDIQNLGLSRFSSGPLPGPQY
ncbi:hypothetical protein GFS31_13880 [Leptolyngbya sp. BL0902]|nr:hypothetical protein GFS31_13880 [Leptolyngbya sp. BL0902]